VPLEKRPSKLAPKGPPPGSLLLPHKVSDNESFETLALKYGVTAKEIALHNFGTSDPNEINWYLREYVGCKVPTRDQRNWRFSSTAAPGLVYIPDRGTPMSPMAASAMKLIDEFSRRSSPGAFIHLHRATIASQLRARVKDPTLINQGQAGLCPSAVVVYSVARSNLPEYVRAVTKLYEFGRATIGKWDLEPGADLKSYRLPVTAGIPEADWIILSSIRDSENWFFDYQSETNNGGAWGGEVAAWLKKAGYSDVLEDWNYGMNKTATNLQKADALYSKGYQVCLLIDADLLMAKTAALSRPNHWVVLASNVRTLFSLPTSPVTMRVFTWGSRRTFPDRPMPLDDFLDYYYGYVAAKY
jgi:hypothetical protein